MTLTTKTLSNGRTLLALFFVTLLAPVIAKADLIDDLGGGKKGGGGSSPNSCSLSPGGATCGGSGPASQGNSSGTNQGAGNPINVITGNKYQREVDLSALPGVLGLEIVRHYNSQYSLPNVPNGVLGRGWKLSYETELYVVSHTIQIVQADGTRIVFNRDARTPSLCSPDNPANGKVLIHKTSRGDEYVWLWNNGRKLSFSATGKLEQIAAPSGEMVSLRYDPQGYLLRVTDPQGRSLHLNYLDKQSARAGDRFRGVQSIDSPVGRFGYAYGSPLPKGATDKTLVLANLVKVSLPTHYDADTKVHAYTERGVSSSSISRIYHYENPQFPTLLTGISVLGTGSDGKLINQRIATYGYDATGRGNLTVKGVPAQWQTGKDGKSHQVAGTGLEQVTLNRSQPGVTLLTNSLGQTTRYTHAIIAGQYRLLEVRGAGCASCGEPNVRYGYDTQGRLNEETKLSAAGVPLLTTKTEHDSIGRVVKVRRIGYQNGRPNPAQLAARYEYAPLASQADAVPSDNPVLIARPSMLPGKEHQIRISYNAAGQPTQVTESGFSPTLDGKNPPTALTRSTIYRYSQINGRSLLTLVDGPLANGPKADPSDSDITRIEFDRRGDFITRVTTPGGFQSVVGHDEAGRLSQVQNTEGFKTTFTYDAQSQLVNVVNLGPGWTKSSVQSYRYDVFGNQVEVGQGENQRYQGQARYGFDLTGHRLWAVNYLGILERNRFDTEGNLLEATTQSTSFQQRQSYRYDSFNRLVAVKDGTGANTQIAYGSQNLPTVLTDSLGRETHYRYDANLQVAEVMEAANAVSTSSVQNTTIKFEHGALGQTNAVIAPNGAVTRTLQDDFGRPLLITSTDSGASIRTFDAANRLIASADANGNRATYEYDVVGRIIKQTVYDAKTRKQTLTAWKYQGKYLVAVEHPAQSERYSYDERVQVVSKAVLLKQADGRFLTSVTHYRYDEQGQLQNVSLPDGSTLNFQRNGQNQVVALEHSKIQTPWLRWLLPAKTLVKDIERDIVGLRSYTYGNGIEARLQRSKEGVLARQVYLTANSNSVHNSNPQMALFRRVLGIGDVQAAESHGPSTQSRSSKLPGALSLPQNARALLDYRYLWDVQGNLLYAQTKGQSSGYAYDAQDRLIVATDPRTTDRYFYDGAGNRLLAQEGIANQKDLSSRTTKINYETNSNRWLSTSDSAGQPVRYDSTGQPLRASNREYSWDAQGELTEVRQANRLLAQYRYNHRGERISKVVGESGSRQTTSHYLYEDHKLLAELNDQGQIIRQYIYLADQPIAVIDSPEGKPLIDEEKSTLALIADLVVIVKAWFSNDDRIAYLHTNHLGAPELATDQDGQAIWQAAYRSFGKAQMVKTVLRTSTMDTQVGNSPAFVLNLRLPGQYEDAETGLYYNDHRYHDPTAGRYLTPDPLGLRGGINTYAYVAGNPLKYIDPTGLILFAFDGTGNSRKPPGSDTVSNVTKFLQAYDQKQNGDAFYITGIGTTDKNMSYKGSIYDGDGFDQRVAKGFDMLDGYIATTKESSVVIDVVGFSRGAAEARVWINQLVGKMQNGLYTANGKSKCVSLRFEGLWDTVPHLGYSHGNESKYNFAISSQVKFAVQAIALNEYRGGPADFNLRSIMPSSGGGTRIERGFIGSHADVGGGYGTGDLSDVALMWMVQQAKSQGIKINDGLISQNGWDVVTNPIVHDKSGNNLFPQDPPSKDDRTVTYTDGKSVKQQQAPIGGMNTAQTKPFITYQPTYCDPAPGNIPGENPGVGTVDMNAYSKWLKAHYGLDIKWQGSGTPCSRN